MISNPSRLNSDHHVLVIDASVAINLLGTGRPADLLRMLNRRVLIDELALKEVTSDPFSKLPGREAIEALIRSGLISPYSSALWRSKCSSISPGRPLLTILATVRPQRSLNLSILA